MKYEETGNWTGTTFEVSATWPAGTDPGLRQTAFGPLQDAAKCSLYSWHNVHNNRLTSRKRVEQVATILLNAGMQVEILERQTVSRRNKVTL